MDDSPRMRGPERIGTHYELLDLPLDADFAEVHRNARALTRELDALRDRPLTPEQTLGAQAPARGRGRAEMTSHLLSWLRKQHAGSDLEAFLMERPHDWIVWEVRQSGMS